MDEATLKDYLVRHDEDFRQLAEQHQEYERQLEELTQKPYLNESDQFQETIIKKKKLFLKDQMHLMMVRFSQEASAH